MSTASAATVSTVLSSMRNGPVGNRPRMTWSRISPDDCRAPRPPPVTRDEAKGAATSGAAAKNGAPVNVAGANNPRTNPQTTSSNGTTRTSTRTATSRRAHAAASWGCGWGRCGGGGGTGL
ncbi:hypothetical protein GA0115246_115462 [Streptomyces sp. SolWspMP-sol7th]|nr:hypothetical protein GA0115246_115462 [Streptomyces sp. SolWspMP-sol7th]